MKSRWTAWLDRRLTCSGLILVSALFIALVNNRYVWSQLALRLDLSSATDLLFVMTAFIAIVALLALSMVWALNTFLLKLVIVVFLLVCAVVSYFHGLGIVFDEMQLRSILSSVQDRNVGEALELMSAQLFIHMLLLGLLPGYLVCRLELKVQSIARDLLSRGLLVLLTFGSFSALLFAHYQHIIHLIGEQKELERYVVPLYPIASMVKYLRKERQRDIQFEVLAQDARRAQVRGSKTVGIMVLGETARADRFSLNGYQRPTNTYLSQRELISFDNAHACGTTTFYATPCVFSFLSEKEYSPYRAEFQSNVLDVLQQVGVRVLWRDNNPDCKDVCDRVEKQDLTENMDSESPYYNKGEYLDAVLLSDLEDYIDRTEGDVFVVLHQMGSHGPAYFRRFPDAMAKFTPFCTKKAQQECESTELNNSYDNTIVYTDYFLDQAIALLERNDDRYSSFLFYVSDHGESLGENGIYLHGAPKILGIKEQLHIPMILWFSDAYRENYPVDYRAIERCKAQRRSQYDVSHTLLALFDVQTAVYRPEYDILVSSCD